MNEGDNRRRRGRRRRNGLVETANALLTLLVIAVVVAVGLLLYGANRFYAPGPVAQEATFLVEKGNGLSTIAGRLAEQGLIEDPTLFRSGAWIMARNTTILPGEYRIAARASMRDILATITEGKPVEYFITVPEGETSFQVAERLNDPAQRLTGDPVPVPAEGSILPGRYDYFPGEKRASVLERMQEEMAQAKSTAWNACSREICGAGKPIASPDKLVILASIVEKETGLATERPQVAGLFVNRLNKRMRLQTDPTIIYGITKGRSQLTGGITQAQKEQETPYNTYVIGGLPPTPIANPGVEALMAVAKPAATKDLYMMAVTPNKPSDGHLFAATLEEHQRNEAKYRERERQLASGGGAGAGSDEAVEDAGSETPAPAVP